MKEAVRVILVDPNARSRQTLQKQLESVGGVELVEVCTAYQMAIRRISALVPDIAIVVLDENVEQALAMVETVANSLPGVNLVPAGAVGVTTAAEGARARAPSAA